VSSTRGDPFGADLPRSSFSDHRSATDDFAENFLRRREQRGQNRRRGVPNVGNSARGWRQRTSTGTGKRGSSTKGERRTSTFCFSFLEEARLDVSSAEERKLSKASGHQTYCVPFGCATPLFVILHAVLLVWADDAEQKVYFVVLLRRFIRPRPAPREPSLASFIRRLLLHLLNSLFALAPSPTRLLALSFPNPAR